MNERIGAFVNGLWVLPLTLCWGASLTYGNESSQARFEWVPTSSVAQTSVSPPAARTSSLAESTEAASQATSEAAARELRRNRHPRKTGWVGFDLRLGLSNGVIGAPATLGLDLVASPWAPLFFYLGVDGNGATVAGHIDAQLNLLTLFTATEWTPFVRGGYTHFRFTGLADEILAAAAPGVEDDLDSIGTSLTFDGVYMHMVQFGGGIDFVGKRGFHFQALFGRSFLLEESGGADDEESVVFTEYQSWNAVFTMGWLFR